MDQRPFVFMIQSGLFCNLFIEIFLSFSGVFLVSKYERSDEIMSLSSRKTLVVIQFNISFFDSNLR